MNATDTISTLWAAGQRLPRLQRGECYTSASSAHPAKMWPDIARHAIAAYSEPGEVVVDPMCGIGTVCVEAVRLGRRAWGLDCEPEWVATTAANLHLTRRHHPGIEARVRRGDARRLAANLPRALRGNVDLIVTSPPYGRATHGRAYTHRETGGKIAKTAYRYSTGKPAPEQLARAGLERLLDGIEQILTACHAVLKPTGRLIVTCRPFNVGGRLLDFPSELALRGERAGFRLEERCAALLAEWRDDFGLRPIHSFFGLHNTRTALESGKPAFLRCHEDVLVLTKDGAP
ncbi:TRM11 family SAM-dependent methyltransferase [Glycomyces arizonensis]|uniref:TRM11 family SAM-dependent methyltransferase n=1 Tax=Glycomyces arizonensis TaxID=256035 RepID=UPI00042806B3|nr:DNA methyltransferase [Glycomyces arizonensis]